MAIEGAGGTPGGISHFFIGSGLSAMGLYLLFSRVVVSAGMWHGYFGMNYGPGGSIGTVTVPFIAGVGLLFFDARAKLGWAMLVGSLVLLTVEVITSLQIHFLPTTLPTLLAMLGLIGGGLGLIARSFRAS
jgi:hypothetical protein